MKRRLDLNGPGSRMVVWVMVLLFLIPGALFLGKTLLKPYLMEASVWDLIIKYSLAAGGTLAAILIILLIIEAIQDRLYDGWYRRHRGVKLNAPGGFYECQYCGCRQVRSFDRQCPVCGKNLY